MSIGSTTAARKAPFVDGFNLTEAGCMGKHRYATPQDARRAIHQRTPSDVTWFRCPVCSGFHLGGRKVRRKIRARAR